MNALIVLPLDAKHYQQLQHLHTRMQAGDAEPLSQQAGQLVAELSCQWIDQVFGDLMRELQQHDASIRLDDSIKAIGEVKAVLRKYLPWATNFFGNDRLMPVVAHYVSLASEQTDAAPTSSHQIGFALPPVLASQAVSSLEQLQQGGGMPLAEALERLIDVIEHSLNPLLRQPKALLKFNFVADKTLNGVVSVTSALSYRNIRKLGQHLPVHLHAPLARHLQKFVRSAA